MEKAKVINRDISEEKQPINKTRLSLFLPADITTSKPKICFDVEYMEKLENEKETWKKLYNEQRERNKKLLKELEIKESQNIDYSLFDSKEIEHLKAAPNVDLFIEQAEELQKLVKIASFAVEENHRKNNLILNQIEKSCIIIEKELGK